MAAHNDALSSEETKTSTLTPSAPPTSVMKLPQMFRRGSAMSNTERPYEKEVQCVSTPENEKRSSLSTLPLRLRRKKTQPHTQLNEQEVEAAERLGALFFSLPSEILAQVITYLSISDVYNLRLASRTFEYILNTSASVVTRHCLSERLPEVACACIETILYPMPTPCPDLSHFLRMLRRQNIVDRQIYHLLSFIQMKIYMTRTETRVLSISDNRHRLIEALQRPGWIVNHFLENYRRIVLYEHPRHRLPATTTTDVDEDPSHNDVANCAACLSLARRVIAPYPAADVMPAYHFYQLMAEHLQIASRVPPLTGKIERRLRGWHGKSAATEENLAIYFILGGMPEVRKVAMMQGSYSSRLGFVTEFVDRVRQAARVNDLVAAGAGSPADSQPKKPKARLRLGSGSGSGAASQKANNKSPGPSRSNSAVTLLSGDGSLSSADTLFDSLAPPFALLNQRHLESLPEIHSFFYDVWRERIDEQGPSEEDVGAPYPWLQRVMAGSGVDFADTRDHEPGLALGASPV